MSRPKERSMPDEAFAIEFQEDLAALRALQTELRRLKKEADDHASAEGRVN